MPATTRINAWYVSQQHACTAGRSLAAWDVSFEAEAQGQRLYSAKLQLRSNSSILVVRVHGLCSVRSIAHSCVFPLPNAHHADNVFSAAHNNQDGSTPFDSFTPSVRRRYTTFWRTFRSKRKTKTEIITRIPRRIAQ